MADINTPGIDLGNLLQNNPVQQSQIGLQQQGLLPMYQQEALGQNLQNQRSMIGLQMLRGLPQMLKQIMSTSGQDPVQAQQVSDAQSAGEGGDVEAYSKSRQPIPWTPQLQQKYNQLQQIDMLYKSNNIPTNFADLAVKGPYDAANLNRQQLATNEWKDFSNVAEYGNTAYAGLPAGSAVRKALSGISDEATLKSTAARLANEAHLNSGQPVDYQNNTTPIDKNSGRPIPGMESAGMSRKDAYEAATKPMKWYRNNMEQSGDLAHYLGIPEETLQANLMRWGQPWLDQQMQRAAITQPLTRQKGTTLGNQQGTAGPQAPTAGPGVKAQGAPNPQAQSAPLINPTTKEKVDTTGLSPQDVNILRMAPTAPGLAKTGEGQLNPNQTEAFKAWTAQKGKLSEGLNSSSERVNEADASIQRMRSLLADPKVNLGPGSSELSKVETFMHQWLGTDPRGANAFQVLQKVIGQDQLNRILSTFHGEGAQVRLGAYETRIIMEALAANPQMTKEAINQLLDWQSSDNQFEKGKLNFQSAGLDAGKDPNKLGMLYDRTHPRVQNVDTALSRWNNVKLNVALPQSEQEYNQLPDHTKYITLDGKTKWKNGPPSTTPAG